MAEGLQIAALSALAFTAACGAIKPMQGEWEVDLVDHDDCTAEFELEQHGDELEGEADVACRIYFTYDVDVYYYDLEDDGVDVIGEFDRRDGEFTIELEFYDSFFDEDIELVFEGELDDGKLSGDVEVNGSDWGEFEGEAG